MYTIHRGINGGWYGCVTADDPDDALTAARELARVLDALRDTGPKRSAGPAILTTAGEECLAYLEANPKATYDDYRAASHTLRTVKWLRAHGYIKLVGDTWRIDRSGGLKADPDNE